MIITYHRSGNWVREACCGGSRVLFSFPGALSAILAYISDNRKCPLCGRSNIAKEVKMYQQIRALRHKIINLGNNT